MTAAPSRPTKLQEIQTRLDEMILEKQDLEAFLATADATERALRVRGFSEGGLLRRVSGVNNPVADHRRDVAKALASLETIGKDIEALTVVLGEEIARDREATITRLSEGVAEHHDEQRELYRRAGTQFADLLQTWNDIVLSNRRFADWRETPDVSGPLGNDWERWSLDEGRFLISPMHGDFMQFLTDLNEVACDPGARNWRVPGSKPPDDYNELVSLVPDCRRKDIELGVARHPDVRSSRTAAQGVNASSWGTAWGSS
ncbi:MAG: hypothetical protein C5B48_08370 [Candidatus Rokuibacteriota bacterium]|nr:MAG: hypothetical protein C5B48_08370 [Candidatus Rokubacteria bacterium]